MKLKSKTQSKSNQEHALLSPSSAKKWLGCPAALACEVGIPNESGQAAVNGTAMHSLAEMQLNSIIKGLEVPLSRNLGAYVLNEGKGPVQALAKAKKGAVLITDDFITQVSKYVDYCRPIIAAAELVEIEYRVNLTRDLHPGHRLQIKHYSGHGLIVDEVMQTFGTADLVALLPNGDNFTLIVGDLKTGRHKVTAKENKQMMLYALGLLRVYKRLHDITAVRLVIFQPYAGGADEWDTTPEALEQFGKFASSAALKAIDAFGRGKKGLTTADFRPSNDACQWCRFSESCNAKRRMVASSVGVPEKIIDEMEDKFPGAAEMKLDQLKAEWDKLPLMRQHIADIEKAMYAALMRGEKVDGLKLVEGRPGNRSWSDAEEVERVINTTSIDGNMLHKSVLLSPTEASKVLDGTGGWELLEHLVTRKPGQPSIATADDKRPAWQPATDEDLAN